MIPTIVDRPGSVLGLFGHGKNWTRGDSGPMRIRLTQLGVPSIDVIEANGSRTSQEETGIMSKETPPTEVGLGRRNVVSISKNVRYAKRSGIFP